VYIYVWAIGKEEEEGEQEKYIGTPASTNFYLEQPRRRIMTRRQNLAKSGVTSPSLTHDGKPARLSILASGRSCEWQTKHDVLML
jgi:hypothetical protein